MREKDLVYICSPLSAPTKAGIQENMRKAAQYARIVSGYFHCRAIAPHGFLPEYLDDMVPEEREIGLAFGLSILKISKAIIICGNRISCGMAGEIQKAKELGIPVYILLEYAEGMAIVKMTQKEEGCA